MVYCRGRRYQRHPAHVNEGIRMTSATPEATTDLDIAKQDMDAYGYCVLKDALSQEQVRQLKARVVEQLEAEVERGMNRVMPDKKQLVKFLLNKGKIFQEVLFNHGLHEVVQHVLGREYLLSSYHAHIAHPGSTKAFHTDQFWMPPPTNARKETLVRPGSITRSKNRGHHVGGELLMDPETISPAVVCNTMWMLDDYSAENGATLLVPGSHHSGRQPDHSLDSNANWIPASGTAGTAVVFEGRTWHSTGANLTKHTRIGLTTNFCAPQFRQQENFLMGTLPEVLDAASPELLAMIGFKTWQGYGAYENHWEWVKRGEYALGELQPVGE